MPRSAKRALSYLLISWLAAASASADLRFVVHVEPFRAAGQYLEVFENGQFRHSCWCSTGNRNLPKLEKYGYRRGYPWNPEETPTGHWQGTDLIKNRVSASYGLPMKFAIGFKANGKDVFAIHQSNSPEDLGKPATHGCVTVAARDAEYLFTLATRYAEGTTLGPVSVDVLAGSAAGRVPRQAPPYRFVLRQNHAQPTSRRAARLTPRVPASVPQQRQEFAAPTPPLVFPSAEGGVVNATTGELSYPPSLPPSLPSNF